MIRGHLQTIVSALFRRVPILTRERERLELIDGDFIDLAWHRSDQKKLAILSHGLEGSANGVYVQAMAHALAEDGWDVLAWNCRSCSGEMNRLRRFYHSGVSEDLGYVVDHALAVHSAEHVALLGFSLGGNITLKYLGELSSDLPARLCAAVAFSVPCDLASSSECLGTWLNRKLYMRQFISSLVKKVIDKSKTIDLGLDMTGLEKIKTFRDFDNRFTAPLHGFRDAEDYWEKASSRPFLSEIRIPTLLVQALNDPFLGKACYPVDEANQNELLTLEIPKSGGHVGFGSIGKKPNWAEKRAVKFLRNFSQLQD